MRKKDGGISYAAVGGTISVFLGRKPVGLIAPHGDGYRYSTYAGRGGRAVHGEVFATVEQVKKSLEEGSDGSR